MMRVLVITALVGAAAGHGYINEPPSRTGAILEGAGECEYGACLWFNQGCTIGCPKCGGVASGFRGCGKDQGKETLPQEFKTYYIKSKRCGINPWCAPGSAPIFDPCGRAAGDTHQGSAGNGGDPPPGYKIGDNGTQMRDGTKALQRTWKVGDVVDASWAIVANHGGGYQYRLCPKDSPQTEECFQKTPLEFVGDEQYIQYCPVDIQEGLMLRNATPEKVPPKKAFPKLCDRTNRTAIPAMRISTGTIPAGSTWTRNPIPACNNPLGGSFNVGCHVSTIDGKYKPLQAKNYQFAPPGPDKARPGLLLGGFGVGACFGCNQKKNPLDCNILGKAGRNNCTLDETIAQGFQWSIVDKVKVPNVPPGEYVVSFRWDCEQTPQIWATCSDVTIVAGQEHVVV